MQQIRQLFRRETSPGRAFIPEIDGLRFIAIMSVVLFHLYGQTMRYYPTRFPEIPSLMLHNGDRGVRLFFVISGFVLALPFARYHLLGAPVVSLRRYFLRRLTRLEPPYIIALLLSSVLIYLVLHQSPGGIAPHLLASLAYSHNLIFGQMSTISGVAWSLEVEVQFYVLVPLLTAVFAVRTPKSRRQFLIAVILMLGAVQAVVPGSLRWQMSIGYYLQFFLAGFLLADFYLTSRPRTASTGWDLVSIAGWPLVFLLPDSFVQWAMPGLVVLLYWAGLHGKLAPRFLRNPWVVCTGGMCYSTYLLHFQLIALATRIAGHQRAWQMWMLSFTLIALASAVFFLLIEKPCMDSQWPRKLVRWLRSLWPARPYITVTADQQPSAAPVK